MHKKSHYSPLVFALILILGVWLGQSLRFSDSNNASESNKFNLVLHQLEELYVDSLDKDALVEKAVEHLLAELDPHSSYIQAKDLKAVNEPMEGSFDGIGVEFNLQNDTILVVAPISGGPSESVGIKAGDKIISVNDSIIAGTQLDNQSVFDLLRGKRGTMVKVGILRHGVNEIIDFNITRGKIPIHSVDVAYMITNNLGYIKINRFSATTPEEFDAAAEALLSQGMQALLLDLRNNPGGYLGAAIHLSNAFLEAGQLIVYTEGRSRDREDFYATRTGRLAHTELTVLIDEGSASASEIVAGAIQDNDRGTVAGRRSFGKGLVQEQFEPGDGSAFRITTQRYYTPTGRCIQRPYENGGQEAYHDDLIGRFESGELSSRDSIHFSDSLRFTTPKGKVVYGGGGIMPDVFIPVDTSGYHHAIALANRKGLIRNFALRYTEEKRATLEAQSLSDFVTFFKLPKTTLKQFEAYCKKEGLTLSLSELNEADLQLLHTQLKAFIARSVWNDAGFYPVIHEIDDTFQKAVAIFE